MIDLFELGIGMFLIALSMMYLAMLGFVVMMFIGSLCEEEFWNSLFWLTMGLFVGGPGVLLLGIVL